MEKDLLGYEELFVKLMKKGGAFTQNDIREIRSIPCDVLVELFQTMQDKNHFRHKYFNSQMDFLAIMYESFVGLIAETRKIKKKQNQQKRKKFLREHPDLYMRDERWDFLGDIANATPEQMQLMWVEGLRLGINMPDTSSLEEPRHEGTPQLDEFFGEGAPNQLVEGSSSGNFEPRFSSTPQSTEISNSWDEFGHNF
ncbi:uncharacterized protein LOC129792458 [Lutzomyia longipalpis]|uniref:uncharacterized protein LOC129792458 n=1 Tax=Lutzomyia longipalpis TaxID=7200 RepID=UPI00248421E4|nr:uncharacterized protein LOC129792458 [Lutzomyia longipalpis]